MEKEKILYIDDEIENLEGFEFTFMNNYEIFTAQNASKGLKILEENSIKVVICDQRMPEITGVDLLKIIKEKFPDSVRIILTAYADLENAVDAINKGEIFRYLSKPWNKNDLKATIENALETYNLKFENKKLFVDLKNTNNILNDKICELKLKNEEYHSLYEEYYSQNEVLKDALLKAEESELLKAKFLTNLSHEIRTPMNGIVGFANLLNELNVSEEKRKYFTSIILNSSYQLLRIIDDLIEISKLETKQVKVINTQLCLNNLLLELLAIYDTKAKENKTPLYLNKTLNDAESTITTDETKLRKILTNLIDNAIRYTNSGFIEVGYYLKNNNIEIYIKDTGIGIAKDMTEKIFDRFSQEDAELSIKSGGLGLGLSIAKENAELIGGKIYVVSEKFKGSTFFLSIPYFQSVNTTVFQIPKISETPKKQLYEILIAEDEEINFIFLETLLLKSGLELKIFHARNGLEAVEICKKTPEIKLVLMDIKMPVLSGFDATYKIREFNTSIPIIAQTAYTEVDEIDRAKESGCNEVITKPIDRKILIDVIKKYLDI
jgi:signal transduction histidine kinase/CheY-like chemotaxis protein